MNKYENNAYFWQKIESLYLSSDFVLTQEIGSAHPLYSNLIYPVKYGVLKPYGSDSYSDIHVFKGSAGESIDAIVICADIMKKDIEAKFLMGVTEKEENEILRFLNQTDFQKSVVIRKGLDFPSWAETEN